MAKERKRTTGFDLMTPEQLKAAQAKSHINKKLHNEQRKTLKQELLALLSEGDVQTRMSLVLIDKILRNEKDAVRAFEVIRDTIGEKPTEKVEAVVENNIIKVDIDDTDE